MKSVDISLFSISFPTTLGGVTYKYVPVGILSVASFLEKHGFNVEIFDSQTYKNASLGTPKSFYYFFKEANSNIIGVGVMAKDLPHVLLGLEMLKRENGDITIILGGPGPTGVARLIMEKFPFIDYVVVGEGEYPALHLMEYLKGKKKHSPSSIKGIVWRDGKKVVVNSHCPRIQNLDSLPLPLYSAIDKNEYNYIYIPSSRGCRHFCTFCDQPALWQGIEVQRSIENLFSEIEYIRKDLGASWGVAFADNEFCADEDRFEEFIEYMKKKKILMYFSMDRRIDNIDEAFLRKARWAGCRLILYGVESGSDFVLKKIRKEFTSDLIKPALLLSAKYIENNIASFIFNYPFETLEDFLKTINLIYPMLFIPTENFITFQIHYLSPLPRTPIFALYKDQLIRKRVSNMLVSRNNLLTYHNFVDNKNKKILILPKSLGKDFEESPEVEKLIQENPFIFPSHYIYKSPHLQVKERIIENLVYLLSINGSPLLFKEDDYWIYFGKNSVVVAGDKDFTPAAYLNMTYKDFTNIENIFLKLKDKKECLIKINLSTFPQGKHGDLVYSFLKTLQARKIKFHLLTLIPRTMLSFTSYIYMKEEFKMPPSPNESPDLFYIHKNHVYHNDMKIGEKSTFKNRTHILNTINSLHKRQPF